MPKPITMLMAGVIGAVLAVLGLAAITPKLAVSTETAAANETKTGQEQPQVYGSR